MNDAKPSLLEPLGTELRALARDLHRLVVLRWELGRLEWEADCRVLRGVAIMVGLAAAAVLAVLPILTVIAAHLLDGTAGITTTGWLLMFCAMWLGLGSGLGWKAWACLRRDFSALQQTRQELAEDARWLRRYLGGEDGDIAPLEVLSPSRDRTP